MRKLAIVAAGALLTIAATGNAYAQVSCTPPPSGMVAWWPGDGDGTDIIGGNNVVSSGAGAGFVSPGYVDDAFQISIAGANFQAANNAAFEQQTITVDFWVRNEPGFSGSSRYVVSKGAIDCVSATWAFYTSAGGLQWYIRTGGSLTFSSIIPGGTIWDDNWHHIAGTFDGATVRLYLDGAEFGGGTAAPSANVRYDLETTSSDLSFGKYLGTCALNFEGDIDEVEIFDRALEDSEIEDIFDADTAGKCKVEPPEPGLTKELTSGDLANAIDPLCDPEDTVEECENRNPAGDPLVDLPDGEPDLVVQVGSTDSTFADFTITYVPEEGAPPVLILDTVPAEWDVIAIDEDNAAGELPIACGDSADDVGDENVDVSRGGKLNKSCRSATHLAWVPDDEAGGDIVVDVETRVNPGRGHKKKTGADIFSPTSCGPLALNDGATAFEIDEEGDLVLRQDGVPGGDTEGNNLQPVVIAQSDPLILVAVADENGDGVIDRTGAGDEDGDGLTDAEEVLEIGTNPCEADTDDDGVEDDVDECPLQGPADASLGQAQFGEPLGCWRQSQCSDGSDNDNDGVTDFDADPSCTSILDDSEDNDDEDGDGVLDGADECPLQGTEVLGQVDVDGCPVEDD